MAEFNLDDYISKQVLVNQLLINQNELLEKLNKSLKNQNSLLQKNLNPPAQSEEFIEDIWHDEMRSGFLVTSQRKKLWNAQIGLIKEFARICEKHNLKWFIHGGTLLGAIRHKGFIPWDDDADVAMLRPDYERFRQIVAEEVREPYFFDPWYNYKLESDEIIGIHEEENLPRIPLSLQKHGPAWWPFWPILRIKDSRTTCIVRKGQKNIPQSVYLDILPFDPVPPFLGDRKTVMKQEAIFEVSSLLLMATIMPWVVNQQMNNGVKFLISHKELNKFFQLPFRKRALQWEKFMSDNYFVAQYVSEFKVFYVHNRPETRFNIADFDDIIYTPFEKTQFPMPAGYEDILTAAYGDWHKYKIFDTPVTEYSTDVSYKEYADKSGFMN